MNRSTDEHFAEEVMTARLLLLGSVFRDEKTGFDRVFLWCYVTPEEQLLAAETEWIWADDYGSCPSGRRLTNEELIRELPPQEEAA